MSFKDRVNAFKRSAAPYALAFAAVAGAGCNATTPTRQSAMSQDNKNYIQKGVQFYKETGASPVNYDACGELQYAVQSRANSSFGASAGGVAGGIAGNQFSNGNPLATVAGAIGGIILGKAAGDMLSGSDISQLQKDCQLQQAISHASGGTVQGGHITHQPGGIYQNGGGYNWQQPAYRGWQIPQPRRW